MEKLVLHHVTLRFRFDVGRVHEACLGNFERYLPFGLGTLDVRALEGREPCWMVSALTAFCIDDELPMVAMYMVSPFWGKE